MAAIQTYDWQIGPGSPILILVQRNIAAATKEARTTVSTLTSNIKFTDDLERELIDHEIDLHEHAEEADLTDRVLKPLVLIAIGIGVPLAIEYFH